MMGEGSGGPEPRAEKHRQTELMEGGAAEPPAHTGHLVPRSSGTGELGTGEPAACGPQPAPGPPARAVPFPGASALSSGGYG